MIQMTLEMAVDDCVARFKRGNSMLVSAALAMRALQQRVEAEEAGDDWNWPAFRAEYILPHISKRWCNVLLRLAPPQATEGEVAQNLKDHRKDQAEKMRDYRSHRELHSHQPRDEPDHYLRTKGCWEVLVEIERVRFYNEVVGPWLRTRRLTAARPSPRI
jgi:hypothetical protein